MVTKYETYFKFRCFKLLRSVIAYKRMFCDNCRNSRALIA